MVLFRDCPQLVLGEVAQRLLRSSAAKDVLLGEVAQDSLQSCRKCRFETGGFITRLLPAVPFSFLIMYIAPPMVAVKSWVEVEDTSS